MCGSFKEKKFYPPLVLKNILDSAIFFTSPSKQMSGEQNIFIPLGRDGQDLLRPEGLEDPKQD
jgi:hypothetical protein